MADIIEPDYENAHLSRAMANYDHALDSLDNTGFMDYRDERGFWSTSGRTFMHETMIGEMFQYGFFPKDRNEWNYEFTDIAFNPFKYYIDNKQELMDMDIQMKNGMFDNVVSEAQYRDRVERLRHEMKQRELIADGSGAGALFGGILSFADLTAFVPYVNVLKPAYNMGRVGKIIARGAEHRAGKYALAGGYYSALQEVILHQAQDLRTLQESGFNTAGGVVLGGGIGGIVQGVKSTNGMFNPKNPSNVFSPDGKLRMGIKGIGESASESVVLKPVIKGGKKTYEVIEATPMFQSVSAAAVKGTDVLRAGAVKGKNVVQTGVKAFGKAGESLIVNTVGRASPVISGLMSRSQVMRNITEHLYDLGGILTKGHTKGEYKASVEDIANRIQSHFDTEILIKAREHFVKLQEKLAGMKGEKYHPVKQAFKNFGSDMKELGADIKAGPSSTGKSRARELGESGETQLRHWEFEDIVASAMYNDITPKIMDNLTSRFGKEGAEMIVQVAKELGDDIHNLNKMIEDMMVEKGLITEDQRLGKDYVAPQLWDGKGIRSNKAAARTFFLEVFGSKPSDEFLDSYFLTEDMFNKLGVEDVTVKGASETKVIKAGDEGMQYKLEILEDWSGNQYYKELDALETAVKNATDQERSLRQQAVLAARELRKSQTDFKNASIDEAKAVLRARQADHEKAVAKRKKLQLEKQKLENELRLAEAEEKARNKLPLKTKRDEQRLNKERKGEVQEAEELLESLEGDANATKADYDFAQGNLTRADNELDNVGADARDLARKRNATKRVSSPRISTLRERLRNINKELHYTTRQIERLEPKLERLNDLVTKATASKQSAKQNKKMYNWVKKNRSSKAKKAKRHLKVLKKKLAKKEKGTPLSNYVEELVDVLGRRTSSKSPMGIIDKELFQSSRTRTRLIKLTNEQRRRAHEIGILRSDFFGSLHEGISEIAKRLAFRHVFGHKGTDDDAILKALVKDVEDDFDGIIADAKRKGRTKRHIEKLKRQKARHMKYVEKGVQRQLGLLELPKDSEGVLSYLMNKSREFNYIRYGSGFLVPSITDLSNVALHSGFGTLSRRNLKALSKTIHGMGNDEIRRLALALETLIHNQRNLKLNNVDDMRRLSGIGDYGTVTHYTTSTVDRVLNGFSKATTHGSGMHWWNTRLKMLAMIEIQHNFVKMAKVYDDLLQKASANDKGAEQQIAELASLGLGREQMAGVIKMMKKHPPEYNDDILELGMARWLDEGPVGQQAYQDVLSALEHVANRAVMTPGKGDVPFFMSSDYGKTLMQFQTYGFVIMTRYMLPAFQRMATYGDMEAFLSFAMGIALGTGVVYAKDIINRGEVKDRTAGEWAYDVIDRSGYITWLTTPSAELMRWFGGTTPSRYYRQQDRFSLLFGPTGGLVNDIFDVKDAAVYGDGEDMFDAMSQLTPFTMHQRIVKNILMD